jgi:dTDP-4-amino-4,6-dideoxygalactose transaminase
MEPLARLGGTPVRSATLPYARQTIEADDVQAVAAALTGDWLTQGPLVGRFEAALATRAGVRHAVVFGSGTAALHAACRAAGLGAGDEAITTPLTFAATAGAIVARGARPAFADIDAGTLTLDPGAVERAATPRTRAVLPVDFAGLPADYDALTAIARARGWVVIADAAHSVGGTYRGRPVGGLADLTVLSFHPAKQMTTGEGGAVLTDRADLAERLRRLRHHAIRYADPARPWRYDVEEPGDNGRITDFQCALGLSQLGKLDRFLEARRRLAARYRDRLDGEKSLALPVLPADRGHAWHLFVAMLRLERLAADQDTILEALRAEGIGVTLHYPLAYRLAAYGARFGHGPGLCPVAEEVERRLVTLPLFPAMSEGDQDDVVRALAKVLAHYAR